MNRAELEVLWQTGRLVSTMAKVQRQHIGGDDAVLFGPEGLLEKQAAHLDDALLGLRGDFANGLVEARRMYAQAFSDATGLEIEPELFTTEFLREYLDPTETEDEETEVSGES